MNLRFKSFYVAIVTLLLFTQNLHAQGETSTARQVYTDWQVTCLAEQPCHMSQVVVQPATSRLILQVKVFGGANPTLLISFPLGILLSTGWQYQIDGGRRTVLPFEICDSEGCHAGVKLSPQFLKSMKRGSKLKIKFFDAAQTSVEPSISLIGFTKAYEALQ